MKQLYEKSHFENHNIKRTRTIFNLHCRENIPWLLFYRMIHDYPLLNRGNVEYRYFYCSSDGTIPALTHSVLLYNSDDVKNGYVLLPSFNDALLGKNIILQNSPLFNYFYFAFNQLFNSCHALDIEKIKDVYKETYKNVDCKSIERNIRDYYSTIDHNGKEVQKAIDLWLELF